MAYVKLVGNIIVQKQPYHEPGFEEAPDDVVCGQFLRNGKYENPAPSMPEPPRPTLEDVVEALKKKGILSEQDLTVRNVTHPTD
jgi:hypothetical protein